MSKLFDRNGTAVNFSNLLTPEAQHVIPKIREHFPTYPSYDLTPAKLAALLKLADQGDCSAYLELAEEMEEKELQYLAVLGTRKRAVAQLEMTVESASPDAAHEEHARFIRAFLKRDTLEEEVFDILDAIGKGFSVTEIIWETSEKTWMPKKLSYVNPRWFTFDKDGQTLLLKTEDGVKPLSPYKYISAFIKAKSGLPIRSGLARPVSWYYLFKNFDMKNWMTFLEVYGQPLRVGKYGPTATEDDKRKLLQAVYRIGADSAAIIPESMMIEFVKADQAASAALYEQFANYADMAISKVVLGQTTTTDAVSGGHAVSKEHNEVRKDIARSDARQLAAILKRDLIRPMIDLNFGPQEEYPRLLVGVPQKEDDLVQFADSVARLVALGLPVSARFVREKLGLLAPDSAEDSFFAQKEG